MLEAGIKGRQEVMVTDENSAAAVGSGLLPVFATPAMVALMEKTAWMSVAPYLNDGEREPLVQSWKLPIMQRPRSACRFGARVSW